MNELDFTAKTVLVVGGSSGIGNGIAQAFRGRGAEVHVWGTRPSADDYAGEPQVLELLANVGCVRSSDANQRPSGKLQGGRWPCLRGMR